MDTAQAATPSTGAHRPLLDRSSDRRGLLFALLAGLVARVFLTTIIHHWNTVPWTSDDATYTRFARALLETGRLDTHHFPVGYPLFMVPFLALGAPAFAAIRVAHILLGVLTILIVARIAESLYGRRAGLIAAWLTALYPPLVFMTGRIMSETLFIALLMSSLLVLLRTDDADAGPGRSALGGALFGIASIVRSNLVAMLAFLPLWLFLRPRADQRVRLVSTTAAMVAAVGIILLPGLYFLRTQGHFIPFATNAGQTFYGANNPLAKGGWIEVEDHQELLQSIPPEVRRSPMAYSKAQQQLGMKWIRENPGKFLGLLPRKLANAWIPGFQQSETTAASPLAAVVLLLSAGLLLVAAIAGRIRCRPTRRDGPLLAVLATYTVMSLAFYGNPRIGLFCAPVLVVYAAAFFDRYVIDRLSPRLA